MFARLEEEEVHPPDRERTTKGEQRRLALKKNVAERLFKVLKKGSFIVSIRRNSGGGWQQQAYDQMQLVYKMADPILWWKGAASHLILF
jgi:hypothetical protein